MEFCCLGKTELQISRIGFGCWATGGHDWGAVDDRNSMEAIRRALDLGINYFDTADVYGLGHSETVLSKALENRRHEVVISTKCGVSWDEKAKIGRDASAKHVALALEASLRRLRLESVPLYLIHWPDPKTPLEETMGALERLRRQGKFRYLGCSNFSVDQLRELRDLGSIDFIQAPYSLLKRGSGKDLLPYCAHEKMGVLAFDVLEKGLLTGKFSSTTRFGPDDVRSRDLLFQGDRFEKNLRRIEWLREVAKEYKVSPAQAAIRWVLDQPPVTAAIVGAKTATQVEENAGAGNARLPAATWKSLEENFRSD